jgi:uncharacterized protein (DUF1697 family)
MTTSFVALLRAVNLGRTARLPMADLRAICERQGYMAVSTYIASGNVVFQTQRDEATVKAELEAALRAYAGTPTTVLVRTGAQMAAVLAANPFRSAAPNRTVAIFLDEPPPADWAMRVSGRTDEEIAAGAREFYVHYGSGMAVSKLRIADAASGTARNMNTIAKLAAMAT